MKEKVIKFNRRVKLGWALILGFLIFITINSFYNYQVTNSDQKGLHQVLQDNTIKYSKALDDLKRIHSNLLNNDDKININDKEAKNIQELINATIQYSKAVKFNKNLLDSALDSSIVLIVGYENAYSIYNSWGRHLKYGFYTTPNEHESQNLSRFINLKDEFGSCSMLSAAIKKGCTHTDTTGYVIVVSSNTVLISSHLKKSIDANFINNNESNENEKIKQYQNTVGIAIKTKSLHDQGYCNDNKKRNVLDELNDNLTINNYTKDIFTNQLLSCSNKLSIKWGIDLITIESTLIDKSYLPYTNDPYTLQKKTLGAFTITEPSLMAVLTAHFY